MYWQRDEGLSGRVLLSGSSWEQTSTIVVLGVGEHEGTVCVGTMRPPAAQHLCCTLSVQGRHFLCYLFTTKTETRSFSRSTMLVMLSCSTSNVMLNHSIIPMMLNYSIIPVMLNYNIIHLMLKCITRPAILGSSTSPVMLLSYRTSSVMLNLCLQRLACETEPLLIRTARYVALVAASRQR